MPEHEKSAAVPSLQVAGPPLSGGATGPGAVSVPDAGGAGGGGVLPPPSPPQPQRIVAERVTAAALTRFPTPSRLCSISRDSRRAPPNCQWGQKGSAGRVVDVLATVVRVEANHHARPRERRLLQNRNTSEIAATAPTMLELSDFVVRVDVVDAVAVANVDTVHACAVSRARSRACRQAPACGVRRSAPPSAALAGWSSPRALGLRLPQVVQMWRDRRDGRSKRASPTTAYYRRSTSHVAGPQSWPPISSASATGRMSAAVYPRAKDRPLFARDGPRPARRRVRADQTGHSRPANMPSPCPGTRAPCPCRHSPAHRRPEARTCGARTPHDSSRPAA